MKKPQIEVAIKLNIGALCSIISVAEAEERSPAAIMNKIVSAKLEEFSHLPLEQGIAVMDEYITKYPIERFAWEIRNTENQRNNDLAAYSFKVSQRTANYLAAWKECCLFKPYAATYLVARIIERFMHELLDTADKEESAPEYVFLEWLYANEQSTTKGGGDFGPD